MSSSPPLLPTPSPDPQPQSPINREPIPTPAGELVGHHPVLSRFELALVTVNPFSYTLLEELRSNTVFAIAQCSKTLFNHIMSSRLHFDHVNLFPTSAENEMAPGRRSWWQERWRVFPQLPPMPALNCKLTERAGGQEAERKSSIAATEGDDEDKPIAKGRPRPAFTNDAIAAPAKWPGPQPSGYKYWATPHWTPLTLLRFVSSPNTMMADRLHCLHLDGHPGVNDDVLRYLILSHDNGLHLLDSNAPYHLPSLQYLSVQGCTNITLSHTRKVFETLHDGLKIRWKKKGYISDSGWFSDGGHPLIFFKFAGAFTADPEYIHAAELLASRETTSSYGKLQSWGRTVYECRVPDDERHILGPFKTFLPEGTVVGKSIELGFWDEYLGDTGLYTHVGRILLVLGAPAVRIEADVGRHGRGSWSFTEKLDMWKTIVKCVGGCGEEVQCLDDEEGWKEGKVDRGLMLCREPGECGKCAEWYCAECKGFICRECREAAIAAWPLMRETVRKYSNCNVGRYSSRDAPKPKTTEVERVEKETESEGVPGSGLIFITCLGDPENLDAAEFKRKHWWCSGCLPGLERFLCPVCDNFSCPYSNCAYSACMSSSCTTCEREICHSCSHLSLWYALCNLCDGVVCPRPSCAKLCSLCFGREFGVKICLKCWRTNFEREGNRVGVFVSEIEKEELGKLYIEKRKREDGQEVFLREFVVEETGLECFREGCEGRVLVCDTCYIKEPERSSTSQKGKYLRDPATGQLSSQNVIACAECVWDMQNGKWEEGKAKMKEMYGEEDIWTSC